MDQTEQPTPDPRFDVDAIYRNETVRYRNADRRMVDTLMRRLIEAPDFLLRLDVRATAGTLPAPTRSEKPIGPAAVVYACGKYVGWSDAPGGPEHGCALPADHEGECDTLPLHAKWLPRRPPAPSYHGLPDVDEDEACCDTPADPEPPMAGYLRAVNSIVGPAFDEVRIAELRAAGLSEESAVAMSDGGYI